MQLTQEAAIAFPQANIPKNCLLERFPYPSRQTLPVSSSRPMPSPSRRSASDHPIAWPRASADDELEGGTDHWADRTQANSAPACQITFVTIDINGLRITSPTTPITDCASNAFFQQQCHSLSSSHHAVVCPDAAPAQRRFWRSPLGCTPDKSQKGRTGVRRMPATLANFMVLPPWPGVRDALLKESGSRTAVASISVDQRISVAG